MAVTAGMSGMEIAMNAPLAASLALAPSGGAASSRAIGLALLLLLAGCANHPIDCAVGFYHADCLPGTAGYSDPNKFAASDDENCRSYDLAFGTPDYAACRVQFSQQHRSPEPTVNFGYSYSTTTVGHR
jgi:hypothetical protein